MTAPIRMLPLFTRSHEGGRSSMTCHYRCGDACDQPVPNTSDNEYFGDLVAAGVSRRAALRAGGAGAALVGLTAWSMPSAAAAAPAAPAGVVPAKGPKSALGFTGIAPTPATTDAVVVPEGFAWAPVISWGDPLFKNTPAFDFDNQTAAAQREQAGYNADYVQFIQGGAGNRGAHQGLVAFNNEYTNDELMFRGVASSADLTDEQLRIVQAAHGLTITEVARRNADSPWRWVQGGERNRRIHTDTPFAMSGPAAGSVHLRTSDDPKGERILGTLNNCAGGETPWGTVLSGEENFNQYFNATGAPDPQGRLKRYGITSAGRGWERIQDRFSVVKEPNEVNRFGWIVEVDPDDPTSTPVKHTALGRFKHEGASVALTADGRVAAYMGDDERFDYIYKFVSKGRYKEGDKKHNMTLLAEGDLYVARLSGDGAADGEYDGTGQWLPLVVDGVSKVPGFSVEEVLIWTRLAADVVGPTKMDRPEDVQPNPVNGRIYAAMTNNSSRTPAQIDEANPRASNKHGHVTEFTEAGGDHAALTFTWKIVLVAGNPSDPQTYFNGYDKSEVSPISCPDNVAFDKAGNLWISTDGMPGQLNYCDALYVMPLEGADKGKLQQFLSVPVGAETCGPVIINEDSVLVAVQHPGEVNGATPENVVSHFPYRGDGQPRPSVIHAYRRHGR
ncbi:phosphatase [Knoellia sinensis KCTC 19936]|uniref:Phosphatase n=1 Tax=Knoellia sinensis KCTC 19936 TaxID=1385520 RepID=A0A0A0J280_9MICO|nr:PhoX family phosphatase [Knoellia sinensis]KGN30804.1 phosphatase [Knoellia sinensis KCTC 19936]